MIPRFVLVCGALLAAGPLFAGSDRWTPLGPGGGSIRVLLSDPSAPGVLYAAGDEPGVYRSADGGASWAWRSLGMAEEYVQRLAADPAHPGTLYSLTWGSGLFRSTNRGALWSQLVDAPAQFGDAIAVLPGDPSTIFLGNGCDVVRSADDGTTWATIFSSFADGCAIQEIIPDPVHPGLLFVATTVAVWKIDQGGGSTLLFKPPSGGLNAMAIAPGDPRTLYATSFAEFWRTRDGGETWTQLGTQLIAGGYCLAVSPASPTTVYLGSSNGGVARSDDGGDTWRRRAAGFPAWDDSPAEVHALVVDATRPASVWAGSLFFGLVASANGGRSWTVPSQHGFAELPVSFVTIDPHDHDTLYAGFGLTLDVERSVDAGRAWSMLAGAPPSSKVVIDSAQPGTLYAVGGGGIFRRGDDDDSWSPLPLRQAINDLVFPSPRTIVAGGGGIFRSVDGGRSWTETLAGNGVPPDGYSNDVRGFVADPTNADTLYAQVVTVPPSPSSFFGPSEIWRSGDGGLTWRRIAADSPAVAVDPTHHGTLWVSAGNGVLRTDDAGLSWTLISRIPAATAIPALVAAPTRPTTLYAGTAGQGVFRSLDGGLTWTPFNTGLGGHLSIARLTVELSDPRHVFALPDAGGLFEVRITD